MGVGDLRYLRDSTPNRVPRDVRAVAANEVTLGAFHDDDGARGVSIIVKLPPGGLADGELTGVVLREPGDVVWWIERLRAVALHVWPGAVLP